MSNEPTTDERLAALEQRVAVLEEHSDHLQTQANENRSRIKQLEKSIKDGLNQLLKTLFGGSK